MNTIIIIGLLMLSAFIIPVVIVTRKQRAEKHRLDQFLDELEKQKNIKIDAHETWSNKVIGADSSRAMALLIHREAGGNETELIDLHHVKNCEVIKSVISSEVEASLQAVNRIGIRFVSRDKSQRDQTFILFNEETDHILGAELRIANQWADRYNALIRSMTRAA